MNCPIDKTALKVIDREGVKIDYCPTCKGVWLDRGELEKIIERSSLHNREGSDKEKHPGYPDLSSKSTKEGLKYKGPEDNYLGRLFRM
jgi:Zn-finger nucleic acid-binding protein